MAIVKSFNSFYKVPDESLMRFFIAVKKNKFDYYEIKQFNKFGIKTNEIMFCDTSQSANANGTQFNYLG